MLLTHKKRIRETADKTQWHHWFAWHPVRTDAGVVFMETVLRRYHLEYADEYWEYKRDDK